MATTSTSSLSSSVTGTLSSAGIGSGLDVNSLVSQLVAAERGPEDTRLTNADAALTSQVTGVASLKGALSTLQSAANALKGSSSFDLRTATVSDTSYFTASATSSAVAGHYDVEVVQLATAGRISSTGFAASGTTTGPNTVVGTGTLAINVGDQEFKVAITSSNNTLAKVRDAINNAADNKGVSATLITDKDGTHLVLASNKTGAGNAVSINTADSVDSDGSTADTSGLSQLFTMAAKDPTKDVAQDAIVKVGGFEIHNATNTIDGAVDGVTLVLKQANDSGETVALDVARDDAAIQSKAQNFVNSYNALIKQVKTLGGYDATTKTGGPLLGDSLLLGVDSQIRRFIADPVTGATGNYRTLATLGITTGADGTLSLDSTKFQKALAADPLSVNNVFSSTNGVAVKIGKYLDDRLASTGEIASRNTSLSTQQKDLEKQRDALDARMVVVQERYMKQFTALDSLLSQLQTTSSYLTQQMQGLSNLANYATSGK
jgi:flagellar hook-associated protein 2